MDKGYVKVFWLKAHCDYAYSKGQTGSVIAEKAKEPMDKGYLIPVPEAEDKVVNPLPEDLPGRDVLFNAGFDNIEKIQEAGDSLLDAGISTTTLKKVKAYFKK